MATGWPGLPPELRQMIIRNIQSDLDRSLRLQEKPSHSPLPLVCREFHFWFAHVNFRAITLDQSRLDDFENLVLRNRMRQNTVKRIFLRVQLPENIGETTLQKSAAASANKAIFLDAMHRFMHIMSFWSLKTKNCPPPMLQFYHIMLHLEVSSPRTAQQHIQAMSAAPATEIAQHVTRQISEREHQREGSKQGLEAQSLDPSSAAQPSPRVFAPARIFDNLIVSQCDTHFISPQFLDQLIRQGMPYLKSFLSEEWDILKIGGDHRHRDGCFEVLDVLRRREISSINLFRDSKVSIRPQGTSEIFPAIRTWNYAMLTTGLRFCDMSSFIDGVRFMVEGGFGAMHFPHLECLVLSTKSISRSLFWHDKSFIAHFLSWAVYSMRYMPKLKILDLWSGSTRDMFLVRMVPVTRGTPDRKGNCRAQQVAISWCSTWLEEHDLEEVFGEFRNSGILLPFEATIWRKNTMKPAKNRPQGHPANYHRLHQRMMHQHKKTTSPHLTTSLTSAIYGPRSAHPVSSARPTARE